MPSPLVILAHSPGAETHARRIADDLGALGFAVSTGPARRTHAARISAAHRVVVLWSRAARGTPALRAAARTAKANGKLVGIALDAAPPPVGRAAQAPRTRAAWRQLLALPDVKPAARFQPRLPPHNRTARARFGRQQVIVRPPPRDTVGVRTFFAVALVALAVGAEAYAVNPSVADTVSDLVARVRALAP